MNQLKNNNLLTNRDRIWKIIFSIYYISFYEQLLSEKLITWWQRIDIITKLLVALTTGTGSGLAIWKIEEFATMWIVLVGSGAILSIINNVMGTAMRLDNLKTVNSSCSALCNDIETFLDDMIAKNDISDDKLYQNFIEKNLLFRLRYKEIRPFIRNDILITESLKKKIRGLVEKALGRWM